MRGCGDAGCGNSAVIPSERSESRDLHLWFLTESAESAESAENSLPGKQFSVSSVLSVRDNRSRRPACSAESPFPIRVRR